MNHRRHGGHAIRTVIMIHQVPAEAGLVGSNKYILSGAGRRLPHGRPQSGFDACISSRVTTVIQVVRDYQINYN